MNWLVTKILKLPFRSASNLPGHPTPTTTQAQTKRTGVHVIFLLWQGTIINPFNKYWIKSVHLSFCLLFFEAAVRIMIGRETYGGPGWICTCRPDSSSVVSRTASYWWRVRSEAPWEKERRDAFPSSLSHPLLFVAERHPRQAICTVKLQLAGVEWTRETTNLQDLYHFYCLVLETYKCIDIFSTKFKFTFLTFL